MSIHVYICVCTLVSLRESRLFLVSDNRKKEKKERRIVKAAKVLLLSLHFQSIKKRLRGEEEGEKKINSHIFCLVRFSFPIPELVVVAFQQLVYLEEKPN